MLRRHDSIFKFFSDDKFLLLKQRVEAEAKYRGLDVLLNQPIVDPDKFSVKLGTMHEQVSAQQLLDDVEHARYLAISASWGKNPHLMFMEVLDSKGQVTTPLKRALFNLDTYAWMPFYHWLQANHKRQHLLRLFLQQNEEQVENYQWQSYLDVVIELTSSNDKYASLDKKQINQLAQKQKEFLLWHVIREMCRLCENPSQRNIWMCEYETTDTSKLPAPVDSVVAIDSRYFAIKSVNLDSQEFKDNFGTKLAIIRGGKFLGAKLIDHYAREKHISQDGYLINCLLKARLEDRQRIPKLMDFVEQPVSMKTRKGVVDAMTKTSISRKVI